MTADDLATLRSRYHVTQQPDNKGSSLVLCNLETKELIAVFKGRSPGVALKLALQFGESAILRDQLRAAVVENQQLKDEKAALQAELDSIPAAASVAAEAAKLAADNNIELTDVNGSGPHGKILKRDVQAILDAREASAVQG